MADDDLAHDLADVTADDLSDDLADAYRLEVADSVTAEADTRLEEVLDPAEEERLAALSLVELVRDGDTDLVPALISRLGEVRAALSGHGGGVVVDAAEVVDLSSGDSAVVLQLNLDGACIACGAAPGTLQGIQGDLLMDEEVSAVTFSSSLLDTFDELGREFVLAHGGVTFV